MISCKLNGKTYSIPFVNARTVRDSDKALRAYDQYMTIAEKIGNRQELSDEEKSMDTAEFYDTMADWFAMLFQRQFSADDVLDYYPSEKFVSDIVSALLTVTRGLADTLGDFPTNPTATTAETTASA